jgi:hypothetical protein
MMLLELGENSFLCHIEVEFPHMISWLRTDGAGQLGRRKPKGFREVSANPDKASSAPAADPLPVRGWAVPAGVAITQIGPHC